MKKLFVLFVVLTLIVGATISISAVELYSDKADDSEPFDKISNSINNDIGIRLEFVGYPSVASYKTAVQQSLDQSNSPGLFTWWSGYRLKDLAESGRIIDLSDEWDNYYSEMGVNPSLADAFKFNGKVYGAPLSVLYSGMFYNKDVFSKYDLAIPNTFDDFLSLCETLKSKGITPIGVKSDPWASFLWFQALIGSFDPDLYTDLTSGEVSYTDEEMVEVMKVWQRMLEKGYFGEPQDYVTVGKQFAKGDVAMVYEATLFTIPLENDYGMIAEDNYSIFTLPSMKTNNNAVIFYETSPIVVSASSSQKDEAIKVLREFYKIENQQIYSDHTNAGFVEGVKIENKTSKKITEMANSGDYLLNLRYYEATPSSIVDTATNSLWEFFYTPSDSVIKDTLNTIQDEAEKSFSK